MSLLCRVIINHYPDQEGEKLESMSATPAISTHREAICHQFSFFLQGKAPKEIHPILTETLPCFFPVGVGTYQHPCRLMRNSEYISLPITLQKGEQNWTNSSVSFYWCHYFLYDVWSLQYKIWFMTENIHALITIMLCKFSRNTLFWGLLVRWLIFKKWHYGNWRYFCFRLGEMKLTVKQPMMSYSVSLYCETRKRMQFLFLLPRWRLSRRCLSVWTLYSTVATLRNLRLAFWQLYFMCANCIHELCIF